MLTRVEKEEQVALLQEAFSRAEGLVAVDYRGLTVDESNGLRAKLREAGEGKILEFRVAKNTLIKRAIAGTRMEGLSDFCSGPTALGIAFEEPATLARIFVDYAKDHEKLQIKGAVVDGEVMDAAGVKVLSALPSKHELRGMLAGTLQAPLRNLAGTLYALLGHMRNALEQRQKQLEA
jgi:large subunit ribosomal protein L10